MVVDASVVVDWVAPDVESDSAAMAALATLVASGPELVAPRLLLEEVSNALLTGVRRGRWNGTAADAASALLRDLPVRLMDEPRDVWRAWDLARRYDNHPIYDLLYVALAERLGTRLLSADAALRTRLIGVDRLIAPEELAG
jgi:predicted nucleic acid-binding protein